MNATHTTEAGKQSAPVFRTTIGKTTYVVRVHFNEKAKETLEDKIKRLLKNEVQQM